MTVFKPRRSGAPSGDRHPDLPSMGGRRPRSSPTKRSRSPCEHLGRGELALLRCRAGRPADGMVAAIEQVGEVLKQHFPRSAADTNEIPDKLIEL